MLTIYVITVLVYTNICYQTTMEQYQWFKMSMRVTENQVQCEFLFIRLILRMSSFNYTCTILKEKTSNLIEYDI